MKKVGHRLLAPVAAGLLGACGGGQPLSPADADLIDDIVRETDARTERRCLATASYDAVTPLTPRYVVFRGSRDTLWINELRSRCPGLRRDDVLVFDLHASRACELDTFTAADRSAFFWRQSGPTCTLGKFREIEPQRLEAIESILRGR